jgi:hypothetical protein
MTPQNELLVLPQTNQSVRMQAPQVTEVVAAVP